MKTGLDADLWLLVPAYCDECDSEAEICTSDLNRAIAKFDTHDKRWEGQGDTKKKNNSK